MGALGYGCRGLGTHWDWGGLGPGVREHLVQVLQAGHLRGGRQGDRVIRPVVVDRAPWLRVQLCGGPAPRARRALRRGAERTSPRPFGHGLEWWVQAGAVEAGVTAVAEQQLAISRTQCARVNLLSGIGGVPARGIQPFSPGVQGTHSRPPIASRCI